jgi:hypothetical protein
MRIRPALAAAALAASTLGIALQPCHAGSGLPVSVDLSRYAPAVGDQGQAADCLGWALAYIESWYGRRDRQPITPDPAALAQTDPTHDVDGALNLLEGQGIIGGWQQEGTAYVQQWIEQTIAAGNPVLLSVPVDQQFYGLQAPYLALPLAGTVLGQHALAAFGYDQTGVWVENSWGTQWGREGWAELSWAFLGDPSVQAWSLSVPAAVPAGMQ